MSRTPARLPGWTLAFVITAAAVSAWPPAADALVYRRDAFHGGELWRVVSAQWVHGSLAMAVADLGAIALCGAFLERRRRGLALAAGLGAWATVALVVHGTPEVQHFQGSSGIASALFVASAGWLALHGRSGRSRALAALAVAACLAKTGLESWSGGSVSGIGLPSGARVLAAAHLAGALAGLCALSGHAWWERRSEGPSSAPPRGGEARRRRCVAEAA